MKLAALAGLVVLLAMCANGSAYFYMYGDTQVLPGEKAVIEICDWEGGQVALSVYKVDTGSLYEYAASPENVGILKSVMSSSPVFTKTLRVHDCENVEVPALDKGFYLVYGQSKDENQSSALLVSRLGLVTKSWDEKLMVYAVDLASGAALEDVAIKVYSNGSIIASGTTDTDGIFQKSGLGDDANPAIIGQLGDDIALMSPYFYSGWGEKSRVYAYTDRPVYRPNQEVYFKAIIWKIENGEYVVPTGTATVEINDAKGNLAYEKNLTINEFGSVSGKFTLSDEPSLGNYGMNVKVGDIISGYGSFEVQEYKKPEYQVSITPQKTQYIRGDKVVADIDASYYFGSPVVGADVEYTVRESSWYRPCYGYRCYYIEYDYGMRPYYGYGEVVASGTGKTGNDGKLEISFTTNNTYNALYSIEAKVTDKSRRVVDGSASVTVARGEFDFLISTDKYSYTKGDTVRIKIGSKNLNDKPVSAFGKLRIEQHQWDEHYTKEKVTTILEQDVETNSEGEAFVDFVPDVAGNFYITIEGKDSRGNNITSEGYFYVSDREPRWDYWENLELTLDKETYKNGETAKLVIKSPVSDFTAFVTVEGDSVYEHYVKSFQGTTGELEIPVMAKYEPNVDVEALIVKNKTQYSDSARLVVPPEEKFLKLEIIPDKDSYMPRDEAVFTVTAKDSEGNPVSAELSLGIADESIYAIVDETTTAIEEFFYGPKWSNVQTETSWGGNYYAKGLAENAVTAAPGGAPMMRDMEGQGAGLVTPQIRKYFPDTAFWHAHVKTDEDGKAVVRVTMPDSLTTWRATARAIDKQFRVGQQTDKVITRKDLLVRLEAPRFFTQKDELVISAVVHNYLKNTKNVVVKLNASGVSVADGTTQTISVAPGSDERVDWKIKVTECCSAHFIVKALTDEESDAVDMVIPIVPHGIEEQDAWAGSIDGSKESVTKNIIVPEGSIFGATNLSVIISPSIASTAFDALEYLASYPYGCVEQTMSAFLPDVYVAQVLRSLNLKNDKLEKELPDMVSKGLQKLYSLQHSDGGWGWWENDETHPYMTAYVVYGLTQAKKAGFTVDENVLERGLESLKTQYAAEKADANTKAYMAYALSFHETPASYPDDSKLNPYGLALKTLAKLNRGEDTGFPAKLKQNATCDELVCHWSSETFKYSWNYNDVETTAYVLMALMKTEPQSEMVEKTVRWLVTTRKGNRWESTKDTAIAVFSLAEYLKISKELSPDYMASVYLNGELVKAVKKDDAFDMDNTIWLNPKTGSNEIRIAKDGSGKLYYSIFLKYFKEDENIKAKSSGIMVDRQYNKTSAKSGEYINVKLTVDVSSDLEYVILEDPLPAGCEVVEDIPRAMPYYYDYYWDYWYSEREVRDEKVAYFMTYLHPGKNEITYTLRAEVPGSYHVMPATVWNMYDEKIRGHSAEDQVEVSDKLVVSITKVAVGENSVDFTVDALKLVEGDLSGEILIQIKDLDGAVLKETREYVSIRESKQSQEFSMPVSLKDGLYTIEYTLTTSDGDVIGGSKRVQVGEAPVQEVPDKTTGPTTPTNEKGGDSTLLLVALLLAVLLAFLYIKRPMGNTKARKKT